VSQKGSIVCYTVDGSEISRPTTWDADKTV